MLVQIPFNLCGGIYTKCINAHYALAGWTDFIKLPNPIPHLAIIVIENDTNCY